MKKVAALQMCSSHFVDDNLKMAAQLIKEAADHGATLAILPEMFAIIGMDCIDKNKLREQFGHGKIQDFLANEALKNKIWLVSGTIPIATQDTNKIKAASIMITMVTSLRVMTKYIYLMPHLPAMNAIKSPPRRHLAIKWSLSIPPLVS